MRTPPPFDLSGRAALVTGAGSPTGIGYAAARLLGDLGASLTLGATTDRVHEHAAELGARGIPTLGVVGDLTREEAAALREHAVRLRGFVRRQVYRRV